MAGISKKLSSQNINIDARSGCGDVATPSGGT